LSIETDVDDNAFLPPTPPPRILLPAAIDRCRQRQRDDKGDDQGDRGGRDAVVIAHADDVDTDAALALSDTKVGAGMDDVAVSTAVVLAVVEGSSANSTRLSPLLPGAFKSGVCPTLVFFVVCFGVGEP
jgi:hypothetical protein